MPNGGAGANLQVQFSPSTVGKTGATTTVLTKDDGDFVLAMPSGATIPSAGLSFVVHGANGNATIAVAASQIAANGLVGRIPLPTNLEPLSVSILAALAALVPATLPATAAPHA
ncbi:MAG: hypothetical protein WCD03_05275, partial [Candidatus Cybelea sp.]